MEMLRHRKPIIISIIQRQISVVRESGGKEEGRLSEAEAGEKEERKKREGKGREEKERKVKKRKENPAFAGGRKTERMERASGAPSK